MNFWLLLVIKLGVIVGGGRFAVGAGGDLGELKISAHMQSRIGPYFAAAASAGPNRSPMG